MHILIIMNSLTSGGAERVTVNLSSYLVEKGYKVTVVTVKDRGRDFYTLDRRISRIYLDSKQSAWQSNRTLVSHKQYIKRFKVLRVLKRSFLFRTLKAIKPIRIVIKQQRPDIVLGMMTSNALKAIIASFGLPTKVIVSERNFPGRKKTNYQEAKLRRRFYRFADGHVVQTHKISCWLRKHTRASNIAIIPNAVKYPIASLPPILAPEKFVGKESKVILAAGKLHEQKGFDLLISAFHRIAKYTPGWMLVILGKGLKTGNQRQNLQMQIDELDLNDRVIMPGCAGNISDWYRRSDIFVLSSRYEGFPNVLLEAMANGCSCISYDCETGPSEIIINEQNGLLIPPEDIDSLAEAMERLVKDEKLRAHIAANAIKVREDFSEHRIMDMWIQFFEGVLRSDSGIIRKITGFRKPCVKYDSI